MKTVQHVGRVVDVTQSRAEVLVRPADGGGCGVGCGCCGTGGGPARRLFVRRDGLNEGDWARITMPACSGYVSTLVVFVVPMALFMVGLIAGAAVDEGAGHGLPTILGGVLGFGVAVMIAVLVNRRLTGEANMTIERLDEQEAMEQLRGSACSAAPE